MKRRRSGKSSKGRRTGEYHEKEEEMREDLTGDEMGGGAIEELSKEELGMKS